MEFFFVGINCAFIGLFLSLFISSISFNNVAFSVSGLITVFSRSPIFFF